jgi:hypothetical protein
MSLIPYSGIAKLLVKAMEQSKDNLLAVVELVRASKVLAAKAEFLYGKSLYTDSTGKPINLEHILIDTENKLMDILVNMDQMPVEKTENKSEKHVDINQ